MNSLSLLLLVFSTSVEYAKCIGPDWSSHPIMQQASEDKIESYTTAFLNISYLDKSTGQVKWEKTEVAKYGEFHVSAVSGIVVHVRSAMVNGDEAFTGCSFPLKPSYGEFPKDEPWIALVRRGRCNFQQKMEHAYNSNASGIIVYNDKDGPHLERMRLQHNVPKEFAAVFTFRWKGEELSRLVDNGTRVTVHISVAEVCPRSTTNINKTSVLFVSVSFIVLMVVSLGWIIFYYVQKCRYIHAKERLSKRLCSAAKKALQKIPTRYIRSDEKIGNELGEIDCCAICIELFKPADVVRLLPCRHEFHKLCIDPWLLENRTCPMCKMDILKYFGFELTGSQESMLRVEQDDPFSDIFYFSPDSHVSTIVETTIIVPVTSHHLPVEVESRATPSTEPAVGTVSQAILDADAGRNATNVFGKSQKTLNKNCENKVLPLRRTVSLDNMASTSHS